MTVSAILKSTALRWTLLLLAGIFLVAVTALYTSSEWMFRRSYDAPPVVLRNAAPASAERGARLSNLFSCQGCHGPHGDVLFEEPFLGRFVAPDMARTAKGYSDPELATFIRTGIKRDHTSAIIMPTGSFSSMSDTDLADVVAWLRSLTPDAQTETRETSVGPVGRVLFLTGAFPMSASMPRDPAPPVDQPATPVGRGEYYVKVACSHCHELEVEHEVVPGLTAPPLRAMGQGYDLAQFEHLLRDGKGAGERELRLMSAVARANFSHFDDTEIAAIHAYLNSLGDGSAR